MAKIWANTIVNNEENFIWFAIMSVVDHVDKVLVWDTGSTDKTVEIIKKIQSLKKDKIIFKEVGEVGDNDFPKVRQAMLDQSQSDWIIVLDGDEIWWEDSIKKVVWEISKKSREVEGIVVPMIVPVGDIYHFQEEKAGQYHLLGKVGHLSLRAINKKIPGLHIDFPYGKESYLDENNQPVQKRSKIIFLNAPYLHVTHLKRSSLQRRADKFKYEIGEPTGKDFKFPEVFYKQYPKIVTSPWVKMSKDELIKSQILTPLRKIKRRILNNDMKNGHGHETLESMSQAVWYNQWTLKKFKKFLSGDILEVGCGIGNFTKSLKGYGNLFAIDIDESYIDEVKKVITGKAGKGDIETGKYFFKDKKFDTIVCINVLEHIEKDQQALGNMYQLLKKEGSLILLVPAHNFLFGRIDESIGHFRRYDSKELTKRLEAYGFKILSCRKLNFFGAVGWFMTGKIFRENRIDEGKIKIFNLLAPFILPFEDLIEPPIGTSILIVAQKGKR